MRSVIDAIVLCGGAGTRLRSVTGEAPKSLAAIGDRPFLDILVNQLRRHGFERVILAVGYQRDLIRSHFASRSHDLSLEYSIESTPLGTGGALRNAADLVKSAAVLIMNGDSYTDADLSSFVAQHRESRADVSVIVVPTDGRVDCGLVAVDPQGRVLGFKEKQSASGMQYVNAGIYVVDKKILYEMPPNQRISLEEEVFPRLLAQGKNIRSFHHSGLCIDIGTPERYLSAQETLANVEPDGFVSVQKGRQEA
ncbi:MAG TPA: nucleotidyltransferase family protein [Candidatus Acidoferrales bacterium]